MERKTKEYQYFVLNYIFTENELKEYLKEIKNILQKNTKYSKEVIDEDFDWVKIVGSIQMGKIFIIF
ncbi:MAG: hypothetical protein HXS48_19625 [Theionarchaea archaeon]|nr:hypothetical protein [Theionarchaea archaeon]